MLELCRSPITSDRLALAGELPPALPRPIHERAALPGTAGLATLPARVSSALLDFSPDCVLQASGFHSAPRPLQTDCTDAPRGLLPGMLGEAFTPLPELAHPPPPPPAPPARSF